MKPKPEDRPDVIATDPSEIEGLITRIKDSNLSVRDAQLVERLLRMVLTLSSLLQRKNASIKLLKKLLFGPRSEKRSASSSPTGPGEPCSPGPSDQSPSTPGAPPESASARRRAGHGRRAAAEFTGAQTVVCRSPEFEPGTACPDRPCRGRLYESADPLVFIRLTGQPSLTATRYEQVVFRCSCCGARFAAPLPDDVAPEKWDASADVQIVVDRYAAGIPFYRSAQALSDAGVPVAASTLYERAASVEQATRPVFEALERAAARGSIFCVDDTPARILTKAPEASDPPPKGRTGRQTSGIVSRVGPWEVALYYTGWRHAGENLERLLGLRPEGLPVPIEMADALSRNWTGSFERIVTKCLAHARRPFVTFETVFPGQSRRVLDDLAAVYGVQEQTHAMTDEQRLAHHQQHSGPIFDELKRWVDEQMANGEVEPNGRLGKALIYLQTHWDGLTQVVRVAGAVLDNNAVERILRLAVVQRKSSLFYKTWAGARVAAHLQSLIQTCRLNGINPRAYLLALVENERAARASPDEWLPWVWAERQAGAEPLAA